ncbi:MAG: ATP-binding cassette domain-containing protein, partial [Planctomycetota bacterium]
FNITHIRKSKAAGLSGGERRRLEIARCLVSDPKIVMLDEPFAGIDPVTVQSIQQVIEQLRSSGISVLITDHAAREILGTVDRCYVIYQGQVLIDGTPDEVKRHPKVQQEYLGNMDAGDSTTPHQPLMPISPANQQSTSTPPHAVVPPPHMGPRRPRGSRSVSQSASQQAPRRVTDV